MKHIALLFALILGLSIGCIIGYNIASTSKNINSTKNNTRKDSFNRERIIDSVLKTGDTVLYEQLKLEYDTCMYDFLAPALIMANKYNYTNAYSDVFDCFHTVLKSGKSYDSSFNFSHFDSKTKNMALEYLNIACERNDKFAIIMRCKYDPTCNYASTRDSIRQNKNKLK